MRMLQAGAVCALLMHLPCPGVAQLPDAPTNLRVLPASSTTGEVVAQMRQIASALGVRCQHCHYGPEGPDLNLLDFPSDAKPAKATARAMMEMVRRLNGDLFTAIPNRGSPPVEIQCITCHRGVPRPQMLEDTLETVVRVAGVDVAVRTDRALRERYHGRFAYDSVSDPSTFSVIGSPRPADTPKRSRYAS